MQEAEQITIELLRERSEEIIVLAQEINQDFQENEQ